MSLVVLAALLFSGSASAAQPTPKITRDGPVSCSKSKATVSVTVTWKKAHRKGAHRGHVVGLIRDRQDGTIRGRKLNSKRLASARSQRIDYRFRFPKRASKRLCNGKAKAEVVASHGHNKDGREVVEI